MFIYYYLLITFNTRQKWTMVKGVCADLRTWQRVMDVDAKDIRILPIILRHAAGPISGV